MKTTGLIILTLFTLNGFFSDSLSNFEKNHRLQSTRTGMVRIPGGTFQPFLKENGKAVQVEIKPFLLDRHAVTNAEFLVFVKANPQWARSKVPALLADENYLSQWESDFKIGDPAIANSPVTRVSWYAASAYAKWVGKRLPSVREWEYAAKAQPKEAEKDLTKIMLNWYSERRPESLPPVESTYENAYGLYDMFGLVWEWTSDFNSVIISADSRSGGTVDANFFCASGSLQAVDKTDYAAFMRFAYRSSLQASYTIGNLGFRCAQSL